MPGQNYISKINGALISASYVVSASHANNASTAFSATTASYATQAANATNANTASLASTASITLRVSSSLTVPDTVSVLLQSPNTPSGFVYNDGSVGLSLSQNNFRIGTGRSLVVDGYLYLSSSNTPPSSPVTLGGTATLTVASGSGDNWFLYAYVGGRWRSASLI